MAIVQLDLDTAEELANRAMREARGSGLPAIEASALNMLAHRAAIRGDLDRAATLEEDADARYRTLGSGVAHPGERTARARIEHRRGTFDRARTLFADGLAYFRTVAGDLHWIAEVLDNLGDLDCDQGNFQGAAANYAEALADWQAIGDIWGVADALTGFAQLAEGVGQPEQGARLLGAADALYEQAGIPLPPHDRINYPKTVAAIRSQLGADAYAHVYGAGRSLTMEQAVAAALALADHVATATADSTVDPQKTEGAEDNPYSDTYTESG
jgi:tetratricopeptide (TPR) repeat protein